MSFNGAEGAARSPHHAGSRPGSILCCPVRRPSPILYRAARVGSRFAHACTINLRVLRPDVPARAGGYVLACTHLSHLEPILVATIVPRPIDYMARSEFFRPRPLAWALRAMGAFRVVRHGVPVEGIRTALARLAAGRVVGIFPEGGVARGRHSACLGGPIKLGVAMVACRAGVPVVPCVVLGTHELNRVGPWLPYKRAKAWVAFGDPIPPVDPGPTRATRRAAYAEVGRRVRASMVDLYADLCATYGLEGQAGETYAEPGTASEPKPPAIGTGAPSVDQVPPSPPGRGRG
ncbi:MAG: putative acyltransferase [Phycisphaerales bacterium]|nr:putative acyltransferase [Phycisphaerales bacterium]